MIDSFTYNGVWFTPENSDNPVTGTLTFDPQKGIELELIGTLVETKRDKGIHEPDFLLGFTTTGKLITLHKCFKFSRSISLPGMETCKYSAIFVLIGAHFQDKKDFVFNSVTARLKYLDVWISNFGFETVDTDRKAKKTQIKYKLPNTIEFKVENNLTGKFYFTYSPPFEKYTHKLSIEQKVEIILHARTAKPFEDVLDDFFHFQNFLTLGTFEASYPLSLYLKSDNLYDTIDKKKNPIKVQVFFQHSVAPNLTRKKILREFLFNYRDISTNFDTIIQKWYSIKNMIDPVKNLLFNSFYNASKFNENRFLNMVQAVETFHRRFRKNEVLPKSKHKKKIKEILDAVAFNHKDWLQNILHFSNEPTLHMRLDELIDEMTNKTVKKIVKDKDQFIKDIKNSRNYYTHYDKSTEKKAKKGGELFHLMERLKVILVCAVLKETGFEDKQIELLLERNKWKFFNHIIN